VEARVTYDPDNIFGKILPGEIPSTRLYEDDEFIVIRDVSPQAPVHLLVIPTGDGPTGPSDLGPDDAPWMGRMVVLATRIAREHGLSDSGYRLIMNCGADGGQTIPHLHLHLLGGRALHGLG